MADKELFRVRKIFVESVTKTVLKQLLDDLLEDEVLNEEEKDSILEENSATSDKARAVIDTVRRKGAEASRKMIVHLQGRDASLYTKLGLSCGQSADTDNPAQQVPVAAAPIQQDWSPVLNSTTDAFWRLKMKDQSIYRVTKENLKNRVALLITNIKFTVERLNRKGAEKDEENMEKLLKSLGYDVVKHTNLTGKAIDQALSEFSKHPKLKETDSVFVVIMSHGKLGAVLGVDFKDDISGDAKQDIFQIDNIYKHLGSEKCPALVDKPKIIIIQACRGEEQGAVLVGDSVKSDVVSDDASQPDPPLPAADEGIEDDNLRYVHKEKDFISLLSSTPYTVSYRQRDLGSILIQYVVQVVNTFAHQDDIEELFRKVMIRFEDFSLQNKRQMPTKDRCTLTRRFYLFPGL